MQCKSCGSDLVRGFTFCLNCGLPVPTEMLTESGLPPRNIDSGPQDDASDASAATAAADIPEENVGDLKPRLLGEERDVGGELKPQLVGGDASVSGKDLKPQLMGLGDEDAGKALKPKYIGGEDHSAGGQNVRAVLQESSSAANDSSVEKLVFCPNCGMRMQHDPNKCEACGMPLGNKPNGAPAASNGIPLFNNDTDPFGGGGFGGFGGAGGLSEDDASRIDSFMSGNSDPMFFNGDSSFNVQASPNDFAQLNEQLASFSAAAGMQTLDVTENTLIRQKEPEKGQERELSDFSMNGDLSSEPIPLSDSGIPVLGDCSMEEDPDSDIVLDPYAFLSTSMDETVPDLFPKSEAGIPEAVPEEIAPASPASPAEPLPPDPFGRADETYEETPYIIEEVTAVSEQPPFLKARTAAENEQSRTEKTAAKPVIEKPDTRNFKAEDTQNADFAERSEVREVQPRKETETAAAQPSNSAVTAPPPARPKPAESTKKCYACGRVMPASDKFCPNCGRSTFGMPNPNTMSSTPAPAPKKKMPVAVIVLLMILLIVIAVVVTVLVMKSGSAAEIVDSLQWTVDSLSAPREL